MTAAAAEAEAPARRPRRRAAKAPEIFRDASDGTGMGLAAVEAYCAALRAYGAADDCPLYPCESAGMLTGLTAWPARVLGVTTPHPRDMRTGGAADVLADWTGVSRLPTRSRVLAWCPDRP